MTELTVSTGGDTPTGTLRPQRSLPGLLVGAIATALVTLSFFLLFWNHFLGLRSGDGSFTSGLYFLKGILPYRDYYFPVTPLFVARSALVVQLFGAFPIATRAAGVFERLVLSVVLYAWLARFFRPKDAALAAMVTILVSAGDYADPISSYNHFTILLAVAAGFVASFALDGSRPARTLWITGVLSGAFAMLSFATKQSIGLAIIVAIPFAVALVLGRLDSIAHALHFLAGYILGATTSAAIVIAWLMHYGIFHAFLTQVFVQGPAAKASRPGDFFVHSWIVFRQQYWWAALLAIPILLLAWRALRNIDRDARRAPGSPLDLAVVTLLGVLSVVVAKILSLDIPTASAVKPTIYAALFGSALLILYYSWRLAAGRLSRLQAQFGLFAVVAFVVAFMTSLSFPVFEAMTVPGLALIVALLLHNYDGWQRWTLYAVCAGLMFCVTQAKLQMPFGFDNFYEPPVKVATQSSALPILRGYQLSPNTINFIDTAVQIVQQNSTPSDTLFTYPEMGVLYGLTGRMPATFAGSHNIDTVSDAFARQEAQRLLKARPAVLIYAPPSEQMLKVNEDFWRGGNRSGQRDLIAAVETLAREYRLAFATRLYPYGDPVFVLVRP